MTPLSGTYSGIGQQVRWGLELAAKEINAAGGVAGRKLDLIFEDEEANPSVAVQKAEKLFQVNKVDFLTGTVNSGSTLAVGQLAERNGKLIADHRVLRGLDHGRQVLAERVPRQRSRRAAIGRAGRVAVEGQAQGEGVLSRSRLRDGPLHRRGLQDERGTNGAAVERRGVRAARFQGLHAVFRADPRRPPAGGLHLGGRQRHRAPADADAGFRSAAEHDDRRRVRHRHLAEHRRDRQGGGRLRDRRRLLAADRHAREQEVRRRLPGRLQDRPRPLRRRFVRPDLRLQGGRREGRLDRDGQGARGPARPQMADAAGREDRSAPATTRPCSRCMWSRSGRGSSRSSARSAPTRRSGPTPAPASDAMAPRWPMRGAVSWDFR